MKCANARAKLRNNVLIRAKCIGFYPAFSLMCRNKTQPESYINPRKRFMPF